MDWEFKTDMVGEAKHSVWGTNVKIGKNLPSDC